MQYVPLSSTQHADIKLTKGTFFYLKDQPMVPVSIVEAPMAALDLPLAFTRKPDNTLAMVAVLSLEKDNNSHVGPKGLWMGGYMPVVVRAHPFALAEQKDKAVVIVNEDSDWLSTQEGRSLFEPNGSPSEVLNNMTNLLQNRFPRPVRDHPVMVAVDQADILVPLSEVSEDLLKVDPKKLADLDDREFVELRQKNALAIIYAQLMSLPRVNRVKNLARRKEKMSERRQHDPGLIQDDDIISFD
jgi:hypothetical protein